MIAVRNLVKTYDRKETLRDVSFTVRPGEITAYLGRNGAGKSTTVKMIAGLLRPTAGEVSGCGFDLPREPLEAKRRLGYVPENSALYATLTPLEYLSLVAELYGVPPLPLAALAAVASSLTLVHSLCAAHFLFWVAAVPVTLAAGWWLARRDRARGAG